MDSFWKSYPTPAPYHSPLNFTQLILSFYKSCVHTIIPRWIYKMDSFWKSYPTPAPYHSPLNFTQLILSFYKSCVHTIIPRWIYKIDSFWKSYPTPAPYHSPLNFTQLILSFLQFFYNFSFPSDGLFSFGIHCCWLWDVVNPEVKLDLCRTAKSEKVEIDLVKECSQTALIGNWNQAPSEVNYFVFLLHTYIQPTLTSTSDTHLNLLLNRTKILIPLVSQQGQPCYPKCHHKPIEQCAAMS
jgi:hypothetical protein